MVIDTCWVSHWPPSLRLEPISMMISLSLVISIWSCLFLFFSLLIMSTIFKTWTSFFYRLWMTSFLESHSVLYIMEYIPIYFFIFWNQSFKVICMISSSFSLDSSQAWIRVISFCRSQFLSFRDLIVVPLSLNSSLNWFICESFCQTIVSNSSNFSFSKPVSLRSSVFDETSLNLYWRLKYPVDNNQIFCLRFLTICWFLLMSSNFQSLAFRLEQFLITSNIQSNQWLIVFSIQGMECASWTSTSEPWKMDHLPTASKDGGASTGKDGIYPNSSYCFLKSSQILVITTWTKESVGAFMSFQTRYFLYIIDFPNCTKKPSLKFRILKKKSNTFSWVTFYFSSLILRSNYFATLDQASFSLRPLLKQRSAVFSSQWNYLFRISQNLLRYLLNSFCLWDSSLVWSAWKKVLIYVCCPFKRPSILLVAWSNASMLPNASRPSTSPDLAAAKLLVSCFMSLSVNLLILYNTIETTMSSTLYRLLIKGIPKHNRQLLRPQILEALQLNLSPSETRSMIKYFTSLKVHEEYMEFFGIAQVKDQKQKIKSVGRYVGLQLPKIFGDKQ